jgi:pyrroloquinoline quinone biosynthesis protein B
VRATILGSAAGGGFPQWNCNCPTCEAVRTGTRPASARTQSSIAVRGSSGPWFLVNASPDLGRQLELLASPTRTGLRSTPIGGVLLTDAEIDHTAGLLLLRESNVPLPVYSSAEVRAALMDGYPVLRMLERYSGVRWSPIEPGERVRLASSSLEVEAFPTGGDPPLYLGENGDGPEAMGLTFRDAETDRVLTYAPALARLDAEILSRLDASDCALVDGTFWHDDELVALGIGNRTARDMGHVPLDGDDGSLAALADLRARTILVHVNNTNPILLEDSRERAELDERGIELGVDGMEIELA